MDTKLVTFIDSILGSHIEFAKSELYYRCPLCNRPDAVKKLAIKMDPLAKDKDGNSIYMNFHCWRDNSHRGKDLFQLLRLIKAPKSKFLELQEILGKKKGLKEFESEINSLFNNNISVDKKNIFLPKEFIPLKYKKSDPYYKNAYNYVTKHRKLTDSDIIKYNIGYCSSGQYSGYIIIPSYDDNMNVNYFVGRSFYGSPNKHKNLNVSKNIIFNELFIDWNSDIILVEGAFDAISVKRNAIPILGKYIPKFLKLKIIQNSVKRVFIALDKDAIKDSINILEDFIKNNIEVYFVKLDGKDPNDIGFKNIWKLIKNSDRVEFEKLIEMKLYERR